MIFQLPPTPPPAHATAFVGATSQPDCPRGSRDCFPKDLVGAVPEVMATLALRSMQLALANLFHPEAEV